MAKREKKNCEHSATTDDEQVRDSNELLTLIRKQMIERRNGPEENRPKKLEIPEPE